MTFTVTLGKDTQEQFLFKRYRHRLHLYGV